MLSSGYSAGNLGIRDTLL